MRSVLTSTAFQAFIRARIGRKNVFEGRSYGKESTVAEIPSVINGERIFTGRKSKQINPWNIYGVPLAESHEVDRNNQAEGNEDFLG